MRFLIDGYNLLHAVWPGEARQIRARAWPRFRQRLLDRLRDRHATRAGPVTVVFDANRSPPGARSEQTAGDIQVLFASGYPSADDLIEELIRTDSAPARLTVVTDDRRLREAARRRGCEAASCLDYIENLEHPPPARPPDAPPAKPEGVTPDEVERWLREFDPDRRG